MKSLKILLMLLWAFVGSLLETSAQESKPGCKMPLYSITWKNVSSPKKSDGSISLFNLTYATHYEIITGDNAKFDFAQATAIPVGQYTVNLKGLANPSKDTDYFVRVYNGEQCFRTDTINLSRIIFAKEIDRLTINVVQGADIPTPQINDEVTFTTIVQNKSTIDASNVELKQILSTSLEVIYFYTDKGQYVKNASTWVIGTLKGGEALKLVIKARVTEMGLAYNTSYISKVDNLNIKYGATLPTQDPFYKSMATTCVSVPIQIKSNQVYTINLRDYNGITWYYKDAAGNFSEITEYTNPAIAEINMDSSLSIKSGGEYTFTKQVDECNFSSCCPVIVESCAGPPIIIDSVYCNPNVDSYNIVAHLQNDNWSIVEKVYYAIANMSFPVLTNMLKRLNALPLTSSAGFVTSRGNAQYVVENVPAFMPNVTLISTDISGQCRTTKIVNAPNCEQAMIPQPMLAENVQFFVPGGEMPMLKVENPQKGLKTVWYADEVGITKVGKGNLFEPSKAGKYYVAFIDKKKNSMSTLTEATVRDITETQPGQFVDVAVCDCDNPQLVPTGKIGEISAIKTYPNPVSDILTINYRVPITTNKAQIIISNINGRRISTIDLNKSGSEIKLDVIKWVEGTYVYSMVVDGSKKASSKFIVRH